MVAVTGTLGAAAAGCLRTRRLMGGENIIRERGTYLEALEHVLEVSPRLAEGRALAGTGKVRCAMDLSDGLARSLHTLGQLNSCGFSVIPERLPRSDYAKEVAQAEGVPLEELLLYYGGDFELLVVIGGGEAGIGEARDAVRDVAGKLTVIGEVVREGEVILADMGGEPREMEDRGWEHFFSSRDVPEDS